MGDELIRRFKRMFRCDSARISRFPEKMFLIIGWRKTSDGEYICNGEPMKFRYLQERVIASGRTKAELLASAREYKRISGLMMERYLKEKLGV